MAGVLRLTADCEPQALGVGLLGERDRGGQQDRLAEADLDREGVAGARSERGQAPGLGPHPMRNRRWEPEQLGRQRMQVDWVQVARDRAVAAPRVSGQPPGGGRLELGRRSAPLGRGRSVAGSAGEVGAALLPHQLVPHPGLGAQRELTPARVGLERGRPHPQRQRTRAKPLGADRVQHLEGRGRQPARGGSAEQHRVRDHRRARLVALQALGVGEPTCLVTIRPIGVLTSCW